MNFLSSVEIRIYVFLLFAIVWFLTMLNLQQPTFSQRDLVVFDGRVVVENLRGPSNSKVVVVALVAAYAPGRLAVDTGRVNDLALVVLLVRGEFGLLFWIALARSGHRECVCERALNVATQC